MTKFLAFVFVATVLGFALGTLLAAPGRRASVNDSAHDGARDVAPLRAAAPALGAPPAERRAAETIVAELDAQRFPGGFLDDEGVKRLDAVCRRKCELGLELYQSWPRHARVARALEERWALLENTFQEHATVLRETEAVLADAGSRKLASVARRARAWSSVHAEEVPVEECVRRVDEARPGGADDDRTAAMLVHLAQFRSAERAAQEALCRRVLDAPKLAPESKKDAQDWLRLLEKVGKPLALGFDDAATGLPASIDRWKGSPVLIHFRSASDWKPLPESELRAIEARHEKVRLVVVQVMIGTPAASPERPDRQLVAPEDGTLASWALRFGIRRTPLFLVADAEGRVAALSHAPAAIEARIAALAAPGLGPQSAPTGAAR